MAYQDLENKLYHSIAILQTNYFQDPNAAAVDCY